MAVSAPRERRERGGIRSWTNSGARFRVWTGHSFTLGANKVTGGCELFVAYHTATETSELGTMLNDKR